MNSRQTVSVQLTDETNDPLKIARIFIIAKFFTGGNHRYSFILGPTDDAGRLCFSYSDIESKRRENAQQSLMDYNTLLTDCDAVIQIEIPTAESLRQSHDVATRWAGGGTTPDYAKDWIRANNSKIQAVPTVIELGEMETALSIKCKQI